MSDKLFIFDTTLRDGEQGPGRAVDEKGGRGFGEQDLAGGYGHGKEQPARISFQREGGGGGAGPTGQHDECADCRGCELWRIALQGDACLLQCGEIGKEKKDGAEHHEDAAADTVEKIAGAGNEPAKFFGDECAECGSCADLLSFIFASETDKMNIQ